LSSCLVLVLARYQQWSVSAHWVSN